MDSGMWLNFGDKIVHQAQPKRHLFASFELLCTTNTYPDTISNTTSEQPKPPSNFLSQSLEQDGTCSI